MLYNGDKGVNVAARPSKSGPAEAGGLSVSSLHLLDSARWPQNQQQFNAAGRDARGIEFADYILCKGVSRACH